MSGHVCARGALRDRLPARLRAARPSSVHLVLDRGAAPAADAPLVRVLDASGLPWHRHVVPGGERVKTLTEVERLARRMVRAGIDRRALVLAVGGGATSDLAGLTAAIALRGVRWGVVGTTLLSAVDAALGGKTAVDLPEGKNLVGAFHAPEFVLVDPRLLSGLPAREWSSGLGEVVKTAMLAGEPLLKRLEKARPADLRRPGATLEAVLRACMRHKAAVVARDPREADERKLLNLGHTFGHALEAAAGPRRLRHGEAVALGLRCALRLADAEGVCAQGYATRVEALLDRLGLPETVPGGMPPRARLTTLMARDKKASDGRLDLILPVAPAEAVLVSGVAPREAADALRRLLD